MNKIILKRSSVEGKIPVAADLEYGELAINYRDGKLFYKTADNQIVTLLSAAPNVDGGSASTEFDPATRIDGGAA